MANKIDHIATVWHSADGAELEFQSTTLLKKVMANAFKHGDTVVVSIEKQATTRSAKQNRYYWGVVIPRVIEFMESTQGQKYSGDDVHTFHLSAVIGMKPEITKVYGEDVILFREIKTSKMTTGEFNEFIEKLRLYWAERGLEIPEPTSDIQQPAKQRDYLDD